MEKASKLALPDQEVTTAVSKYYGETLKTNKDLKTSACCSTADMSPLMSKCMANVPEEVSAKFYGCGNPLPLGIEGLTLVDLGSGSGQDCYIAAQLVGPNGSVIGVDMTDNQLSVARKYVDEFTATMKYPKPNINFIKGNIEELGKTGIEKSSVDLVISNCVINLSPRKADVIQGVWDILKEGGELHFSDVYCDRRLPDAVKSHEVLIGECIGGALYIEDFRRICAKVGFLDPRVLSITPIAINDPELAEICGNARFFSITYRLFKLDGMEDRQEDYGQVGIYSGTIPGHTHSYALDQEHVFIKNKPLLIDSNTSLIIGSSWLSQHFMAWGEASTHYGLFEASPLLNISQPAGGDSQSSKSAKKPKLESAGAAAPSCTPSMG